MNDLFALPKRPTNIQLELEDPIRKRFNISLSFSTSFQVSQFGFNFLVYLQEGTGKESRNSEGKLDKAKLLNLIE